MANNKSTNLSDEDTKSRIFRNAAQLFSERGFNGVSMREISEKSGVSKPTIYYYFKSKEGIYTELVDTGISYIFSSFASIRQMDVPIKQKLVLIVQHLFQQSLQHPDFVKFFLKLSTSSESVPFLEELKKQANKKSRAFFNMIEEGKESGEFATSVDSRLAAGIISGTLEHFIWQQFSSNKKILSDQLAENIITFLSKGLNE